MTQERSKVIAETANPFDGKILPRYSCISEAASPELNWELADSEGYIADEDKEDEAPPTPATPASNYGQSSKSSAPGHSIFNPSTSPTASKKPKKEKDKKGAKKKGKPFNLEAEKDIMKSCIADSSVVSTNLLNALRLINREQEQISENQAAVAHFDNCKLLRRKILRYVSY